MEKIYIGFSTHNGNILSKTIEMIEESKYSHVYIRRTSKYGEYIYQASGLSVNFMNIDIFKQHNTVIEEYEFELLDEKRDKLVSFFIKYAGASYDIGLLFKILIIIIAKRANINLTFKGNNTQKFICSELGAFFCEMILDIPISVDINFITPKELNPIIKKYGKQVI